MNAMAAYNWMPSASLIALAATLALLPVGWLLWRYPKAQGAQRLRQLVLITAFLTFDLIVFGAFTRLSDSGLGCPDWPGCYGQTTPAQAHAQISVEQASAPHGPVTHTKAWIEMIHRYWASAVGALIVLIAFWAWRQSLRFRQNTQSDAPAASVGLACLTVVWVCLQGAFGAWTVTLKLQPLIVTAHLLGGVMLLCLLVAQAAQMRPFTETPVLRDDLRTLLGFCTSVLLIQIALGAWVSSNYAVLACQSFPSCNGQWLPEMDMRQGFELWRPLGQTAAGQALALPALVAIHWVHRLMALVVTLILLVLAHRLYRLQQLRKTALALYGLVALQVLTGISNVVLGWPLMAALMHTAGAAALMAVLTAVMMSTREDEFTVTLSRLSASRLGESQFDSTTRARLGS